MSQLFNFNTPITKDVDLVAQYKEETLLFTLTHVAGAGTVSLYSPFTSNDLKINNVAWDTANQLVLNEATIGKKFVITANNPAVATQWYTFNNSPFAYTNDDCELLLDIPSLDPFLTGDGLLPSYSFRRFFYSVHNAIRHMTSRTFADCYKVKHSGSNVFADLTSQCQDHFPNFSDNSFIFTNLEDTSTGFFANAFNHNDGDSTALPKNGFKFPKLKTTQGNIFAYMFANSSAITTLPEGSFQFPELETIGGNSGFGRYMFYAANIKTLPEGSFQFPKLKNCGESFMNGFAADNSQLQLPVGSFSFPALEIAGSNAFMSFYKDSLEGASGTYPALPVGSFQFPNLKTVGGNFCTTFYYPVYANITIPALPQGAFNMDSVETVGAEWFNAFCTQKAGATRGNEGVAIKAVADIEDVYVDGVATTIPQGEYLYLNAAEE